MATVGKISVDLEAKDAKWSSGLAKGEKELKGFVDKTQSAFKALKFDGSASIGNVSALGSGLAAVTQKAEGFATAIRTGKGATDMFKEGLESLPIVGKFAQAGSAIRELVTGEKAAKQLAIELAAEAAEIAGHFSKANAAAATLGKHGFAKEAAGITGDTNSKVAPLNDEISKLQADIGKREEVYAKPWIPVWESEKRKLAQDKMKLASMRAERDGILKEALVHAQEIKKQETESHIQFDRQLDNRLAASEAELQEKVLKRQGKALDSAIVAVKERARSEKDAIQDSVSDYNLEQLGISDEEKKHRKDKASDALAQVDKETAATIADLQAEQQRKLFEQTNDHENNLNKIKAESEAARLEATGKHLDAELAKVNEAYAEEIAALEKKYREEHRTTGVDRNDPQLKAEESEAAAKRDAGTELAKFKDKKEHQKLLQEEKKKELEQEKKAAEEWARDQKKLIEESESPLEAYEHKIREFTSALDDGKISQHQFDNLADKETHKTFRELEGHKREFDYGSLSGRERHFDIPQLERASTPLEKLLDEAKKRAQKQAETDDNIRKTWLILEKAFGGIAQTIDITSFVGATP